jgi:23S rRNA (adenine2503-C2)-methyltransferase
VNLLQLTPPAAEERLAAWLAARAEPAYRLRQIVPRLWQRPVAAWSDATDLPAPLRAELDEAFPLPRPGLRAEQRSVDGTVKFLWEFDHDGTVESVLIPEGTRRTLCISSQVGCAYGCVFCATGRMGFVRHLEAWEIAAQTRELMLRSDEGRPSNIVFMGMGEPLHNWAAVDTALTILNHPLGCGIGARHITVSTIGIVPALAHLAARPEQFGLALSLHATTSERRRRLMPVEGKYDLEQVLEALGQFRRRVTFEYVMIAGENDTAEDAERLAGLARRVGAHVNLLPLHPGGAPGLTPSSVDTIQSFADVLVQAGVATTVRTSRGLDIAAACGQLRTEVGGVAPE